MSTIIRGKLKLKGSKDGSSKKKKTNESNQSESLSTATNTSSNILTNHAETYIKIDPEALLTESQKRFLKRKNEVEDRAIKTLKTQSYRDRVESFNMKLSTMTEHNDIPRISAAGNG